MPKEKTAALSAPNDSEDREIELTVSEFCQRLSASDRRVELIGAFHASEAAQGRSKDVTTAFEARFDAFVNQPV